jgi:hypothetical protein
MASVPSKRIAVGGLLLSYKRGYHYIIIFIATQQSNVAEGRDAIVLMQMWRRKRRRRRRSRRRSRKRRRRRRRR